MTDLAALKGHMFQAFPVDWEAMHPITMGSWETD